MSTSHASHNENLCLFLQKNGQYNDWVITTAFYSALHYTQHKLFPFTYNQISYNCFNDYYNAKKINKITKHKCMIKLVEQNIPTIRARYRWLYDCCMNARYSNYNVSPQKAKKASTYMTDIKKVCI